ncbi:hypothetical protein TNCV_505301 [Trichonephila clavipes]|nr:hypothetical protein TNCV_505301 [Trichonephila clavipes]
MPRNGINKALYSLPTISHRMEAEQCEAAHASDIQLRIRRVRLVKSSGILRRMENVTNCTTSSKYRCYSTLNMNQKRSNWKSYPMVFKTRGWGVPYTARLNQFTTLAPLSYMTTKIGPIEAWLV